MIEVVVNDLTAIDAIDIVHELKNHGYVQGIDFEFSYHKAEYDGFSSYNETHGKYTVFTFYNDAVGSWFYLKYKK